MIMSITNKFFQDYCAAKERRLKNHIDIDKAEGDFSLPAIKNKKVGYIVATASPATKAHIELANKAINDLDLDVLYFIIWPFHFIPGFHSNNMIPWVKEQKHYPWEIRVSLLQKAIKDFGNNRICILEESKEWYIESEKCFKINDSSSYFWTGSWYVIRKLQAMIENIMGGEFLIILLQALISLILMYML